MRKIIFGISLMLFFGCNSIQKETPISVEINKNWQFKGVDTLDWKSATVPGNIFTDLLDHNIIEDPFIKNNEEKVQWVSNKNWEYKTNFQLSDEVLSKENIELHFEGLDTYAEIYINGKHQLNTENAFRKYIVPVKKILKKENELRIVFTNSNSVGENKSKKNPYQLPEGNRIYTRKAQFQTGWDWGPKLNTSGIWKLVSIKAWTGLKFDNIFIRQNEIDKTKANLSVEIEIESTTIKT